MVQEVERLGVHMDSPFLCLASLPRQSQLEPALERFARSLATQRKIVIMLPL